MRSLFGSQLLLLSAALGLLGDLALAQNDTASDGTQDALADPVPVTVETPLGQVIGVQIGGVDNFLGIQYAEVGERFGKSTVVDTPWQEPYEATEDGPICYQEVQDPENPPVMAEECLYLNVYRPSNFTSPLTTMLWVHGGSFTSGYGWDPLFRGNNLAGDQGLIIVQPNYRLGAFGFAATGPNGENGMNGIVDVIVALQWVQENIESFGGDPASVTLFGESAGSLAIAALTVSPLAEGLFNRAILMSGVSMGGWSPVSHKRAEAMASEYLAMMNATSFDEIKDRDMYPADVAYSYNLTRNPYPDQRLIYTWDPEVLPDAPKELYKDPNNFNVKEMIVGSVSFDGVLGIYPYELWMPNYESDLKAGFGEELAVQSLEALAYPDSEFATYVAIDGAYQVACPTREFAVLASNISEGSVYHYVFGHNHALDFTFLSNKFQQPEFDYAGNGWTSHASELLLLFNHDLGPVLLKAPAFTEADHAVVAEFQNRFANFAKTGKPTYESGSEWPPVPLENLGNATLEGGAIAHTVPYLKFAGPNQTVMIDGSDKTGACAIINTAIMAADAAYEAADNAPPEVPSVTATIVTSAPKPVTKAPAAPASGSSSLGFWMASVFLFMLLGI